MLAVMPSPTPTQADTPAHLPMQEGYGSGGESANPCQAKQTRPLRDEDAEREEHIRACGQLMEAAMLRWEAYGNFSDRGEADFWRVEMEFAIKARSAEQVARMESERGLGAKGCSRV